MSTYVTAVPAYGRDYKSAKAVKEAWNAGRDFRIQSYNESGYVNKEDWAIYGVGRKLSIRYNNLRSVVNI